MVVFIAPNDAFWLRLECDGSGLAFIVPATALPVDFVAVLVVLDVFFALAHHDLVSPTRLDELEGNVERRR